MGLTKALWHLEKALSEIHSTHSDDEELQQRFLIFEAWTESLIARVGETAKERDKVAA
jgi:hypothetical protein